MLKELNVDKEERLIIEDFKKYYILRNTHTIVYFFYFREYYI